VFPVLLAAMAAAAPDDRWQVVPSLPDYRPEQLHENLMSIARSQYDARAAVLAGLASSSDWEARQAYVRESMEKMLGGFPERTPLNARVIRTVQYDGYRVENAVYESRPGFYVTANVYVPDGEGPFPGLLHPCGHSSNGKAYDTYQMVDIAAAKQGYVVVAYDPVSQGERFQIVREDGRSRVGEGTQEHSHQGCQAYLIGTNLAQIRIWDGIRSLDYLVSRPDVDPERVGVTGNSGGGTLTTYLCAVDPRIAAASPNCYVTTLMRRFLSRVGADAEQNLIPQIELGIDHSDMLSVMAPRPVQIGAKTLDFFPVEGTREAYAELRRAYEGVGAPDAVELVEEEGEHAFSVGLREAMIRWMNRWLQTPTPDYREPDIQPVDESELLCTPTGQVLTSLGGTTVHDILKDAALHAIPTRPTLGTADDVAAHRRTVVDAARELLGWETGDAPLSTRTVALERLDGIDVEKVAFTSEPGIIVPALVAAPTGAGRLPAVIYVHEGGKSADMDEVLRLARDGNRVIAIDFRGVGETRSPHGDPSRYYQRHGVETDLAYTSFMLGKPLVGLRARDVVRAGDYARSRGDAGDVSVLGVGMGALIALHAALLDEQFVSVTVRDLLVSYKSVVLNELYTHHPNRFIPSVIGRYDVGDVVAAIAPRSVTIESCLDEMEQPAKADVVTEEYGIARSAFAALGASANLQLP